MRDGEEILHGIDLDPLPNSPEVWEQIRIFASAEQARQLEVKLDKVQELAGRTTEEVELREHVYQVITQGTWWPTYSPKELADLLRKVATTDEERIFADMIEDQPGAEVMPQERKHEALELLAQMGVT